MGNSDGGGATGSVFKITDELIKRIGEADDAFDKLVNNSQKRVSAMNKVFEDIANGSGMRALKEAFSFETPSLQKLTQSSGVIAGNFAKTANSVLDMTDRIDKASGSLAQIVQILNAVQHIDTGKLFGAGTLERAVDNWIQGGANIKNAIAARILGKQGDAQNIAEYEAMLKRLAEATQKAEERLRAVSQQATQTSRTTKQAAADLRAAKDATTNEREILEAKKQARIRKEQEIEDKRLAKAEEKLATAILSVAAAREKALAAEERLQKKAVIREHSKDFNSAMTYASTPGNTDTYNKRALAIKVLQEAIKNLTDDERKNGDAHEKLKQKIQELNKAQQETLGNTRRHTEEIARSYGQIFNLGDQLGRKIALIFSISSMKGYVEKLAAATGEMELQQVALRSILQNRTKADEIFNKTKELATKSPFRVQQLVTYTKQLAAYRIESNKLYDTTKRLADVSAGLGVDMQRLILAYGQVKAAAYLRGTEVRQFTEAGVNLYGELQRYFEEVKGQAYTTAQIVDMISKRKVTFEDIEQIFKRLTDKGGIFYNMQEIQAETLYGKIEKLKDLWYLFLNDLGKENKSLLSAGVDLPSYVLKHWENFVDIAKIIGGILILLRLRTYQLGLTMSQVFSMQFRNGLMTAAASTRTLTALMIGLRNVIVGMGTAIKARPVIAALLLIASVVTSLIMRHKQLNDALAENDIEYSRSIKPINELIASYNALKKSANEALKAQLDNSSNAELAKNFEQRKAVVEKLQQQLDSKGVKLDIPIESLSKENIDSFFDYAWKKAYEFERGARAMKNSITEHSEDREGLFNIWGDNLKTDTKDLANKEREILSTQAEMDNLISVVAARYDDLSTSSKRYFDTIKDGQKPGQSQVSYLMQVHEAMNEIIFDQSKLASKEGKDAFKEFQRVSLRIKADWGGYKDAEEEWVKNELQKVKKDFETQGIKDPAVISAILDDAGAKAGWTEHQIWLAKQEFKVPLIFDPDKVQENIKSIQQQLDEAFENKTYNITIKANGLDTLTAWEQMDADAQEKLKELKKLISQREHNSKATIRDDSYDSIANQASQNDIIEWLRARGYGKEVDELLYGKNHNNNAARQEKDIWEARIDVMKKMQARYDSIRKYLDEKTASERTKEFFKEAALSTGLSEKFIKDMNLGNGGIVKAIDDLIKNPPSKATAKDLEKLKAWKAEIEMKIDEEKLKNELDKAKKEINNAFDGYSLFTKMSDIGLHVTDIDKIFPGLPRTLQDVEKQIQKSFSIPSEIFAIKDDKERDKKLEEVLGKDKLKQFQDDIARLRKQEVDHSRQTVEQLVKDYKNALTGQLEIDQWYARERIKIYENIKDPTMQQQMRNNLDKKKNQKDSELAWNQFKDSDYYVKIFENLEHVSTRVLSDINNRLTGLRGSLNGLKPEQLKQIVQEQQKIQDAIIDKHPFQGITKDLVDYIKFLKERKKLETSLIESLNEEARLRNQQRDISSQITALKEEVDLKAKNNELSQEDEMLLNSKIAFLSISLTHIGELLTKQNGITQNFQKKISEGEKASERLAKKLEKSKDAISGVGKRAQEFAAIWSQDVANSIAKAAEAFDDITDGVIQLLRTVPNLFDNTAKVAKTVTDMVGEETKEVTNNVVGTIADTTQATTEGVKAGSEAASTAIKGVEKASVILAIISAALQVATAIAKLLNDESDIDDQMAANERSIKSLQRAYDRLTESINNAWRAQDLNNYTSDAIDKQKKMIEMYRRQIALENDRKDPDKDKIQDYFDKIEDAEKAIKERIASIKEELGALGSEANYKNAAQEFTDAWVDAFAEGEDALDAMNGKFNDMMKNFVKKQAMQRLVKAYLEPLFLKLDAAATDANGKLRSPEDMLAGVTAVMEEYKDASGPLNEALKKLMEYFKQAGFDIQGLNNEGLSALQQGIQGITENTAEALESLLNSMRFALFEQKNDVAEMRRMLSEHFNGSSSDSPILSELKNLVSIQTSIRRTIESVVSPSGGKMMLMVKGIS